MKLWMLTEISGESREATAFVWAEDPGEARWLLREKTGGPARVCMEVQPQEEAGMLALIGFSATGAVTRPVIVRAEQTCFGCPALWDAWDEDGNQWSLYYRNGTGTAMRVAAEDAAHAAGLAFEDGDPFSGVISLEEFCERAGLELRLA